MTGEGIPISTSLLANGLSLVRLGDACLVHPARNDAVIKAETSKKIFPWVGIMCPQTLPVPGNVGDFPMSANYTDPVKKVLCPENQPFLGLPLPGKLLVFLDVLYMLSPAGGQCALVLVI